MVYVSMILGILYALWAGFCWVLRGGKFGAIVRAVLKREPGTTITRIACAGLMAAPLGLVLGWWALALWASIYVSMTLGYFDESMGLEQVGRDHAFLALWGATVAAIAISPLVFYQGAAALLWAFGGASAVAWYAINKSFGRRFGTDWTERAEFMTGCAFGAALFLAATFG